jgi:hypothetical protein
MLVRGIAPQRPALTPFDIRSGEVEHRHQAGFDDHPRMQECRSPFQILPVRRQSLRHRDPERTDACGSAKGGRIGFGDRQDPARTALIDRRPAGDRAQRGPGRDDLELIRRIRYRLRDHRHQDLVDDRQPDRRGASWFERGLAAEDRAGRGSGANSAARELEGQVERPRQLHRRVSRIDPCGPGTRRRRLLIQIEMHRDCRSDRQQHRPVRDGGGLRQLDRTTGDAQAGVEALKGRDAGDCRRRNPDAAGFDSVRRGPDQPAPDRGAQQRRGDPVEDEADERRRQIDVEPDRQSVLVEKRPERFARGGADGPFRDGVAKQWRTKCSFASEDEWRAGGGRRRCGASKQPVEARQRFIVWRRDVDGVAFEPVASYLQIRMSDQVCREGPLESGQLVGTRTWDEGETSDDLVQLLCARTHEASSFDCQCARRCMLPTPRPPCI